MERRSDGSGGGGGKIKIGVCVMEKKVSGWDVAIISGAKFSSSCWLCFLGLVAMLG